MYLHINTNSMAMADQKLLSELQDLMDEWADKETCFVKACRRNDIDTVTKLYRNQSVDFDIDSLFAYVCKRGYMQIAKILYKMGMHLNASTSTNKFNIYRRGEFILMASLEMGQLEIAKWLIECGIDIGRIYKKAFMKACGNGKLEIVQWLYSLRVINQPPDIYSIAFFKACGHDQLEIAQWLHSLKAFSNDCGHDLYVTNVHYKCEYALRISCFNGLIDIVKWLYSLRVDINAKNGEPLRLACTSGYLDLAKLLVAYGANINAVHKKYSSVFQATCKYGQIEIAKWLVDIGVDIDYHTIRQAFDNACKQDNLEFAKWLYECGRIDNNECDYIRTTIDNT